MKALSTHYLNAKRCISPCDVQLTEKLRNAHSTGLTRYKYEFLLCKNILSFLIVLIYPRISPRVDTWEDLSDSALSVCQPKNGEEGCIIFKPISALWSGSQWPEQYVCPLSSDFPVLRIPENSSGSNLLDHFMETGVGEVAAIVKQWEKQIRKKSSLKHLLTGFLSPVILTPKASLSVVRIRKHLKTEESSSPLMWFVVRLRHCLDHSFLRTHRPWFFYCGFLSMFSVWTDPPLLLAPGTVKSWNLQHIKDNKSCYLSHKLVIIAIYLPRHHWRQENQFFWVPCGRYTL